MNKEYAARQKEDMRAILKSPQGRRVLWRILQAAQVDQHGFVPADPYATAFHCGQKSIGLFVETIIKQANNAALLQMENEYLSETAALQAQADKEQDEMNLD